MLRVYLDTCSVQRPLDTPSQTRIRLEAEAILALFEHINAGEIELISSTILAFEIARNPLPERRELSEQFLQKAAYTVEVNKQIAQRAAAFVSHGIKSADALHLAAAESAQVDYFCTCDARFMRRAKNLSGLPIQVVSPLELIEVIEQ
jgi:predicted nucleic acid-binding protein